MNLLKSIFVLSVSDDHHRRKLSRPSSIRSTSLCVKCKASVHLQCDPQKTRECRPQECEICSKKISPEMLQWVYTKDKIDKKQVIAKGITSALNRCHRHLLITSLGRFCIYRATLHQEGDTQEVAVKSFRASDREEFEKELQIHWYISGSAEKKKLH